MTEYTVDDKAKPVSYDLLEPVIINDGACSGTGNTDDDSPKGSLDDGVGGTGTTYSIDDGKTTSCNNEEDNNYDDSGGGNGSSTETTITIDDDNTDDGDDSTCSKNDVDPESDGGCDSGGSDDGSDGTTDDNEELNTATIDISSATFTGTTSIGVSPGSCKIAGGVGMLTFTPTDCSGSGSASVSCSDSNISVTMGAAPDVSAVFAPVTQSFSISGYESEDGKPFSFNLTITYPGGATGNASITVFYYNNYTCVERYKIVTSTVDDGTISPSGTVFVKKGEDQSFTIMPSSGHIVSEVKVDGTSKGGISKYTFKKVGRDHTIEADFTGGTGVPMITVTHDDNGMVCPDGNVGVAYGKSKTFKIVPDEGYGVADVKVDGVSQGKIAKYTFTNVTGPHTLEATFKKGATYTISVSTTGTGGGTVTPPGPSVEIAQGGSQRFFFTPTGVNAVRSVKVDGKAVSCYDSFTFDNVGMNHTIEVEFGTGDWTVTASADSHSTISPSGSVTCATGSSKTFKITTAEGYCVAKILVDGSDKGAARTITLSNIRKNHTISVVTKPADYIITVTKSGEGSVYADGVAINGTKLGVASGDSVELTFVPVDKLHRVTSVLVDGKTYSGANSLSFTNIGANHTVAVNFGTYDYSIAVTKEGSGTIKPNASAIGVNAGCKRTIDFEAASGWYIDHLTVDDVLYGASETFEFNRVGKNHKINAVFKEGTGDHVINISSDGPGKCDPTGQQTVEHGGELSVTMSANDNSYLKSVTVDGKDVGRPAEFTFKGVGNPHSLHASFLASPTYAITVDCPTTATANPLHAEVMKCDDVTIDIGEVNGYHIKDVAIDGKSFGAISGVEFTEVGQAHSVTISTFDANTNKFKISVSSTPAGACTTNPLQDIMVEQGESTDVYCTPNDGFTLIDTIIDGSSIGAVDSISFNNVGKAHSVVFKLAGPGIINVSVNVLEEDTNADVPADVYSDVTFSVDAVNGGSVENSSCTTPNIKGSGPATGVAKVTTAQIGGKNAQYKLSMNVSPTADGWSEGEASVLQTVAPGQNTSTCHFTVFVKGPNSDVEEWDATLKVYVTGAGNQGATCKNGEAEGPVSGGSVIVTGSDIPKSPITLKDAGGGLYTGTFHLKTKIDAGKQSEVDINFSKNGFASVESGTTLKCDSAQSTVTSVVNLTTQEDDRILPIVIQFKDSELDTLIKGSGLITVVDLKDSLIYSPTDGELIFPSTAFASNSSIDLSIESTYWENKKIAISKETASPCENASVYVEEVDLTPSVGNLLITLLDSKTDKIGLVTVASVNITGPSVSQTQTTASNCKFTYLPRKQLTVTVSANKYATHTQTVTVDSWNTSEEITMDRNMGDLIIRLFTPNSRTTLYTLPATVRIVKTGVVDKSQIITTGMFTVPNLPYGDGYTIYVNAGTYIDQEEYTYNYSGDDYEDIYLTEKYQPNPGDPATLEILTVDSSNNQPIYATVKLTNKTTLVDVGTKNTDSGKCSFAVITGQDYIISATNPEYKDASQLTSIDAWKVNETVSLDKIPAPGTLNITVYKGYESILTTPESSILITEANGTSHNLTTSGGKASITLSSEQSINITCTCTGYETEQTTLYINSGDNNEEIHMNKIKSTSGKITITLKDSSTNNLITDSIKVWFDTHDITTITGKAEFDSIPNGSYTIYASGPVYEEGHSFVYVDGEDVEEDITLTHKAVPVKVTLRFANANTSATVTTPATVTFGTNVTENVTAGFITYNSVDPNKTYNIVIKALGYKTMTTSRYVSEGEDFDETFDLYPGRDPVTDPVSLTVSLYNANATGSLIKEYASVKIPALGEEQNTSVGKVTISNMPKGSYVVQAQASAFNDKQTEIPVYNTNTTYDFYMTPLDPDLPGTCGVVFQHSFPTGTSKPEIQMTNYLGSVTYQSTFENLNAYPYYLRKTRIVAGSYDETYDYASDLTISGITQIVRVTFYWYCKPGVKTAQSDDNLKYPSYTPIPDEIKLYFNGKEFPTTVADGEVIQFTKSYDPKNNTANNKLLYDAYEYLHFSPNLWNEGMKEADKLHQVNNKIYGETEGNCKVKLSFSFGYYKGYYDDDGRT